MMLLHHTPNSLLQHTAQFVRFDLIVVNCERLASYESFFGQRQSLEIGRAQIDFFAFLANVYFSFIIYDIRYMHTY